MRTAIFFVLLAGAPALLGQSSAPLTASPWASLPSQPGRMIVVTPQTQDWWAQPPKAGQRDPLFAENRSFAFAAPAPPGSMGKMEPIPTQWPSVKIEAIPTQWPALKVVPIGDTDAAATATSNPALFAQPARR
jgi:hypothetical protein